MDEKLLRIIQRKFARYHNVLFFVILVYNCERMFHAPETILGFWPAAVAGLLLAAECFVLKKEKDSRRNLIILRYAGVLAVMFFLVQSRFLYTACLGLILLSLFIMEYFLLIEFMDVYYRVVFLLTIGIPFELMAILSGALSGISGTSIYLSSFVIGVYLFVIGILSALFTKIVRENDERIFAQSRLIDDVNEANDALLSNQEKVKRANELLGIKKIELEAAYNKINSVNSEMMIQNAIIKYISSSLEMGKLMTLVTESILNEIGVDACCIVLYPNATEEGESGIRNLAGKPRYRFKIRSKLSPAFTEHLSSSIRINCFDQYLLENKTWVDNHVKDGEYSFLKNSTVRSMIIVPFIKNEETIGCLFVGHPSYEYFKENINFFEGIVAQFLVALDNANLYAKMESMAVRDGLTGIYNRRYLTHLFQEAMNESLVNKSPLSVALFDIDHFKNVNDTYGHLFGDEVIKAFAALAARIAEEYEGFVGRYGGEEFVIIFPGMGLEESYEPVSMVHSRVKEMGLEYNGQPVLVKVSVGITSYPETCSNPNDLLNRADWAMYYSKQSGRDRITIDNDSIRETVMVK